MKKQFLMLLSIMTLLSVVCLGLQAEIRMLNGDTFVCDVKTESLSFITDFTEITFKPEQLQEIYFTSPETELTVIRTIYKGEKFTGLLANKSIEIVAMGNKMTLLKDKIDRITFSTVNKNIFEYQVEVSLRTGDFFHGEITTPEIKIKTSYGLFKLDPNDISSIAFEGAGKVTTTVEMKNGNIAKGIIKNDYLPIRLMGDQNIQIVPDKISTVKFNR